MIIAHPEPTSFSHALAHAAKDRLLADGHEVVVSDLHAMGFNPLNDRSNFTTLKNPDRFHQQTEENHAFEQHGFSTEIQNEMDKLVWCDVLLCYCPIHWFSVPAILKAWFDKILASGFAYGGGRWYDKGVFQGKRAMIVMTTGAPDFMYRNDGVQGDILDILFPINHGVFYFIGMLPLKPFMVYGVTHMTDEQRAEVLQEYAAVVADIDTRTPIVYRTLADIFSKSGLPYVPDKATQMIVTVNAMMTAWMDKDQAALFACVDTANFEAIHTDKGVHMKSIHELWAKRLMHDELPVHTHDSHTFPAPHTLQCFMHVIDQLTGHRIKLSKMTYTFDAMDNKVIKMVREEVLGK